MNPPDCCHRSHQEKLQNQNFLQNIRKYNKCFHMTSFRAKEIRKHGFMSTFKIQGQLYHKPGSLIPLPDETEKFFQFSKTLLYPEVPRFGGNPSSKTFSRRNQGIAVPGTDIK